MSGHSKWAKIHRAKEASDQKKGQSFTKLSNAITLAVRESGGIGDPDFNFKLRLAIEKAREENMPKENIQRAIDRASGKEEGSAIEEITYEGYGPGGVGLLVQAVTDNKQRTIQEVKNIFDRQGGGVASPGSVSFNFQKIGCIVVCCSENTDEAMLKMIDEGAEDIDDLGDGNLEVFVPVENLVAFKAKLTSLGFKVESMEVIQRPISSLTITDGKTISQILTLIEQLEALDDIQKVYTNIEIPEELIK